MSYHNVLFPLNIGIFALSEMSFSTSIIKSRSGREIRSSNWSNSEQKYIIKNCILNEEEFMQFNSFFRARLGQNHSFRFKDYADYKISKQKIMPISEDRKTFQIYKLYSDSISPYKRIITSPVHDSIKCFINNEEAQIENIDPDGLIIIKKVLDKDESLHIDCEFDVTARFNQDNYKYNITECGAIKLSDIEIIEVKV